MTRLDQPGAASRADPGNALGVLEIRIHPRRGREEPHAGQLGGLARVTFVGGEPPREAQRVHRLAGAAERRHVAAGTALGVDLPVALEVRQAVGLRGVGPPVRARAVIVVRVAAGGDARAVEDRRGLEFEEAVCVGPERGDVADDGGLASRVSGADFDQLLRINPESTRRLRRRRGQSRKNEQRKEPFHLVAHGTHGIRGNA